MLEQAIDTNSKAFKSSVYGLPVFRESRVDGPLLVLKPSVDIAGNRRESRVDSLLKFRESRVDSLPKFLKSSIRVLTTLLESFVNQPMGAVKSGLNSPKSTLFSILSLLKERVDVGCKFHELLVDFGPERS